jgi:hypothetical protein
MKTRLDWSDPEVRRDAAIVIGLFAFGLILTAALGLVTIWLLDLVGVWPEARVGVSLSDRPSLPRSGRS